MSIRTPSMEAATGALLIIGLVGCMAAHCPGALASSLDQRMARSRDDDGPVTLSGLVETRTIASVSTRARPSDPRSESKRAHFLPANVELSRSQWSGGSSAAVGVNRLDYRVSYGTARSAVSVGVGAINYSVQQLPAGLQYGPMTTGTMPSVSVAYRQRFDEKIQLNVEASRASYGASSGTSSQMPDTLTTTRVGLEYQPVRNSVFGVERASLALNMGSSGNFSMKIRHGRPMFYMRSKF